MRHCPNPECPETIILGRPAEYRDEIARCPACGTDLVGHSSDAPPETSPPLEIPATCVAVFRDLGPAYAARAALESHGYSVFLRDEHIVSIDWLYSQAVGGIKLIVFDAPPDEAREALAVAAPDVFDDLPEMHLPPTPYDVCPKCGSEDVEPSASVNRIKALSLLFFIFILLVPFTAHWESMSCRSCGHTWKAR